MTHFNELFFCEFVLPNGPFEVMVGKNNQGAKGSEKNPFQVLIMKQLLYMYVTYFFFELVCILSHHGEEIQSRHLQHHLWLA